MIENLCPDSQSLPAESAGLGLKPRYCTDTGQACVTLPPPPPSPNSYSPCRTQLSLESPSPKKASLLLKLEVRYGEFPGSLAVRIPGFPCRGQIQSLIGELRSCSHMALPKRKKERKTWEGLKVEGLCLIDHLTPSLTLPWPLFPSFPCYLPSSSFPGMPTIVQATFCA